MKKLLWLFAGLVAVVLAIGTWQNRRPSPSAILTTAGVAGVTCLDGLASKIRKLALLKTIAVIVSVTATQWFCRRKQQNLLSL
ncbi:MAG: hypothetical protein IKT68_04135 [Clostridia bacterium]|nr:hypothetical protein [Clostridia bacterium]